MHAKVFDDFDALEATNDKLWITGKASNTLFWLCVVKQGDIFIMVIIRLVYVCGGLPSNLSERTVCSNKSES
jgi:hypothetical protein